MQYSCDCSPAATVFRVQSFNPQALLSSFARHIRKANHFVLYKILQLSFFAHNANVSLITRMKVHFSISIPHLSNNSLALLFLSVLCLPLKSWLYLLHWTKKQIHLYSNVEWQIQYCRILSDVLKWKKEQAPIFAWCKRRNDGGCVSPSLQSCCARITARSLAWRRLSCTNSQARHYFRFQGGLLDLFSILFCRRFFLSCPAWCY